jgi:multidrug efflux pump subunit AcrA (membrane-fusion protein)
MMSVPVESPAIAAVVAAPLAADAQADAIFGSNGASLTRSTSRRRKRWVGVAAGALIVVLVALLATRALGAETQHYQTGIATTRDVVSTWDGVVTIEPKSQASVGFPVSGTVATVDVREGDTVEVGQTLATLDESALNETLHQKESALAQANLTLSRALAGEDVGASGAPGGSDGSAAPASGDNGANQVPSAPSGGASTPDPQLAQAQQAVLQAQQQVDAALAASSTALASANTVCAAGGQVDGSSGSVAASDVTACESALQQVLELQQATAQSQTNLANVSRSLDALRLEQSAASTGAESSTTGTGGTAPTGSTSSTGSSPSSADLAKYQAAVDAAAVDVVAAQQAIGQATIVSPIAGTVTSMGLAVGNEVSSGSSTDTIEVVGTGGYEATTVVGVDDVADIEVGQAATVVPDGVGRRIAGEVVAISISPVEDATSTSYRVTVALKGATDDLRIGSTGSVAIITERADRVITVPTSAVIAGANRSTVRVLDGSDVETVTVDVGIIGSSWTEIRDGIETGQRVVLADLDEPLPSAATDAGNGNQPGAGAGFGPPGGFPGGGGFRGNFSGR